MDATLRQDIKLLPPGHYIGHRKILLVGISLSFLIIILALYIANSRMSFFGRASSRVSTTTIAGNLSLDNSYIFASPISATANGSSAIRMTVIILNDQGLGVASQNISLKASGEGVKISPVSPVSDTFGRATFDLSASAPGNYTISAEVSGSSLPQTVSVAFL